MVLEYIFYFCLLLVTAGIFLLWIIFAFSEGLDNNRMKLSMRIIGILTTVFICAFLVYKMKRNEQERKERERIEAMRPPKSEEEIWIEQKVELLEELRWYLDDNIIITPAQYDTIVKILLPNYRSKVLKKLQEEHSK